MPANVTRSSAGETFTDTILYPEYVWVDLGPAVSAPTTVSITADQPTVTVNENVALQSGPIATFTISLSAPLSSDVTIDYSIDGTATAGLDYEAPPQDSVTIPAGKTTATIKVQTLSDGMFTQNGESFSVSLTGVSTTGGQDVTISNVPAQVTIIETLTHVADWYGTGHKVPFTGTYQDMESKYNQLVQASQSTQQQIQNTLKDEQDQTAKIGSAILGYAAQTTVFLADLAVTALGGVNPSTVASIITRIGNAVAHISDFYHSFLQSSENRDLRALGVLVLQATNNIIKDATKLSNVGLVADFLNKTYDFQQQVSDFETAIQNDRTSLNRLNHEYYSIYGPAIIDIGAFISTRLEADPAGASAQNQASIVGSSPVTTQTPSSALLNLTQAIASFAAPSSMGPGSVLSTALNEQQPQQLFAPNHTLAH